MGHTTDAARHRGPHTGVHGGRGGGQPDTVGRHAARLDSDMLQQTHGDIARLNVCNLVICSVVPPYILLEVPHK